MVPELEQVIQNVLYSRRPVALVTVGHTYPKDWLAQAGVRFPWGLPARIAGVAIEVEESDDHPEMLKVLAISVTRRGSGVGNEDHVWYSQAAAFNPEKLAYLGTSLSNIAWEVRGNGHSQSEPKP
jgi:hypothetical protein